MTLRRYFAHAFVLLIAVTLAGYATIGHHISSASLRLGAVNAEGLVLGQGGEVGDLSLGRMSTIIKPLNVPASAPTPHTPLTYQVADGEDLKAIAAKFNLSVEQVRWSNPALIGTEKVTPGDKLLLPPIPGVVVLAHDGDSADTIAAAYKADAQAIADFNYLRDPGYLTEGEQLIVPNGQGGTLMHEAPPAPPPAAPKAAAPARSLSRNPGSPSVLSSRGGPVGTYSNSRFPYGYCTWYVASRRPVAWLGNAWEWYGNARAMGVAVGGTPAPGAIMVTRESGWGHVAYVEQVFPDGSWRVSEMNFVGWGVVSQRTIAPGRVPLIGFIY